MLRLIAALLCVSVLSFTSGDAEAIKLGRIAKAAALIKTYQTYKKTHPKTGKVYVGRTSGTNSPIANIKKRDSEHHRSQDGFGRAKIDKTSSNKDAIRGREQQEIELHRNDGSGADQINGISPKNPKRQQYLDAANNEFGKSK